MLAEPMAETTPVKIGVIAPTSGSLATYGESVANGIKLAFSEINAAGGVLGGRQIEATYMMAEIGSTSLMLAGVIRTLTTMLCLLSTVRCSL